MSRFLFQAAYTADAIAAFVSQPQDRVAGARRLVEHLGGQFVSADFCLGDYDVAVIAAFPDETVAVAFALAASAAGHLKAIRTTRLLTPEEFLAAQQQAHGTSYQPPTRA